MSIAPSIARSPPARPAVRDYLSFSAVNLYQACPLRYHFRYIAGLPEEVVSASLVFGTALHASVEFHFRELLIGNRPPDLDTLLAVLWDSWNTRVDQKIQFAKGDNVNSIGSLADRTLRTFQASSFATPAGTVIAVEEELRGELVAGRLAHGQRSL